MIFLHGLITENLPLSKLEHVKQDQKKDSEKRFLVQMHRSEPLKDMLTYFQANAHMFIEFGLSLLLMAIKKERLVPSNQEHMKMLDPIVELLGKSLYSVHTSVTIASMRVLCLISKWKLPAIELSMPIIVKRVFELISRQGGTNSDLVQTTFRLLTSIIKDCKFVQISQKQLAAIISLLTPDLEDPERQATTFSLIRAILGRKYVFTEIYDLMDVVSRIMITSQSAQVRELCRQAYLQFLLDYPHGPLRLKKQISFILRNLTFEFESGRESALKLLESVLSKFTDNVLFEFSDTLFLSLVMTLINDESPKCREKAVS
jgi:U3 small nucleolar RNA-associated protein 20